MATLSDDELLARLKRAVADEHRITREVLCLLREVSRRRLHLKRGSGSFFTFLVKEHGYDEAGASLRERAIRVLESLPEIEHKLEERTLSVSTVAQAETFFRQEAKRKQTPCTAERKREILEKLEHCSKRETERVLAQEAPEAPRPDRKRVIADGQTEIRFTADAELVGLIERVREQSSHRNLEAGLNGLFKFMAKEVLRKLDPGREPERRAQAGKRRKQAEPESLSPDRVAPSQSLSLDLVAPSQVQAPLQTQASPAPAPSHPLPKRSRVIPAAVKRAVWRRDQGRCGYVSEKNGVRCESRFRLEYDHVLSWALGGENTLENLRLVCKAHNLEHAREVFGEEKIESYLARPKTPD